MDCNCYHEKPKIYFFFVQDIERRQEINSTRRVTLENKDS